jgi:hypothetical protein
MHVRHLGQLPVVLGRSALSLQVSWLVVLPNSPKPLEKFAHNWYDIGYAIIFHTVEEGGGTACEQRGFFSGSRLSLSARLPCCAVLLRRLAPILRVLLGHTVTSLPWAFPWTVAPFFI